MTISSIHQLEKTIGDMLLKQTELKRSRIVNGLSIRGADLSKFITDNVSLSYDVSDVALIFEISAMNLATLVNLERFSSSITSTPSFSFKVGIIALKFAFPHLSPRPINVPCTWLAPA